MTFDDLTITNMNWLNEFQHNQIEQSRERSLTGGLLIQEGLKKFGRPITLEGWLDRETLDFVYAKEASVSQGFPVILPDGREFTVVFDRSRGLAVDAVPVAPFLDASNTPDWQYRVTLHLVTVEPTGV